MRPLFFFFTLLIGFEVYSNTVMTEPKFKASCRKKIHGRFQVDKFDDWTIITNDMVSELSGISIYQARPFLAHSLPNNYMEQGKRVGTWNIVGDDYWLVCHHTKMKLVIEQKLPSGLKICRATEDAVAINVECN